MTSWLTFIIYGLACYRLALMLSEDSGPVRMFSKLRSFLKREAKHNPVFRKTDLHRGVECLRCSSVWVATLVANYALLRDRLPGWVVLTVDIFLLGMALSAMSILCHRAFPKRN